MNPSTTHIIDEMHKDAPETGTALKWSEVAEFLNSCGFVCEQRSCVHQWDGKHNVLRAGEAHNLIHEYAHWLVASKTRRRVPGFGLGPEPEGWGKIPVKLTDKNIAKEECLASLLGIMIDRALGGDWLSHAVEHSWGYHNTEVDIEEQRALVDEIAARFPMKGFDIDLDKLETCGAAVRQPEPEEEKWIQIGWI